jgi:glycosyltransferase involved in cell wall biosynthesis
VGAGVNVWFPTVRAGSGSDVFVRRLAAGLERHGAHCQVSWFPHGYEVFPPLLEAARMPPGTDVVVAGGWYGFACRRPGIPLVVVEHHCVFDPVYRSGASLAQRVYHDLAMRPYSRASFRRASRVSTVSQYTAHSLSRAFGLRDVAVIPNWVDPALFSPAADSRMRRDGPFRLLFVGNASRRKGADLLPRIMAELGPRFELRYTAGLRAAGSAPPLANMIPLGRLDDAELVEQYRHCDALLFPTRFEGFGYAAAEAMACGKPVVTSDVSSLPEVVVDGETGILCPVDDVRAYAAACRRLASAPDEAVRMGTAGRTRVLERYTEAQAIPRYLELLAEAGR